MKNDVKVLYVKREGNFHSIRELEVSTKLKLNNIKDYITGKLKVKRSVVAEDQKRSMNLPLYLPLSTCPNNRFIIYYYPLQC